MKKVYQANGKLLLSSEYVVLDGAKALALPTKLGQSIEIKESSGMDIHWASLDPQGEKWFEAVFDLFNLEVKKTTDEPRAEYLKTLLENCIRLNSDFLSKWKKYRISANLGFHPDWGLGSSSTLISCLSEWAQVDPYALLKKTSDGSGYDIACAHSDCPIFYQIKEDKLEISESGFNPSFKDMLYLVYTGNKQDTAKSVLKYRDLKKPSDKELEKFNKLTESLAEAKKIDEFSSFIHEHDTKMSELLKTPRLKETSGMTDFWGEIKPLGAWGGDFFLATSDRDEQSTTAYFQEKGFKEIFKYEDLILS